jgi:hypothetical protein
MAAIEEQTIFELYISSHIHLFITNKLLLYKLQQHNLYVYISHNGREQQPMPSVIALALCRQSWHRIC